VVGLELSMRRQQIAARLGVRRDQALRAVSDFALEADHRLVLGRLAVGRFAGDLD
jgi:hypothetical protein